MNNGENIKIRKMNPGDYDNVILLLRNTEGITIREADSRQATERYLDRNPGLSFVAEQDGLIIGCVMCGHDGRRGYLQHLAVLPEFRRKGIGSELVSVTLKKLKQVGIEKTHIDVLSGNDSAMEYWGSTGWQRRDDIVKFSFINASNPDV